MLSMFQGAIASKYYCMCKDRYFKDCANSMTFNLYKFSVFVLDASSRSLQETHMYAVALGILSSITLRNKWSVTSLTKYLQGDK